MLNNKGEFNRSRIARLSLGGLDYEKKPILEEDKVESEKMMEEWEGIKNSSIWKKSQTR